LPLLPLLLLLLLLLHHTGRRCLINPGLLILCCWSAAVGAAAAATRLVCPSRSCHQRQGASAPDWRGDTAAAGHRPHSCLLALLLLRLLLLPWLLLLLGWLCSWLQVGC
jgi:hypothetical protein